jgi:hypothetical protein
MKWEGRWRDGKDRAYCAADSLLQEKKRPETKIKGKKLYNLPVSSIHKWNSRVNRRGARERDGETRENLCTFFELVCAAKLDSYVCTSC